MVVSATVERFYVVMAVPKAKEAPLTHKLVWSSVAEDEFDCMQGDELVAWVYKHGDVWQAWALDPHDPTTLKRGERHETESKAKAAATSAATKALRKLKRSVD